MSATDKALTLLKDELRDLDNERKKLEKAIEALTKRSVQRATGKSPAKPKAAPKKGGKTQTQRFLDDVKRHPGTTVAESAKRLKVPANNLYATAGNLTKQKRVTKKGPKYTASK
jgi:predicted acylesterase/phospholipase RssA